MVKFLLFADYHYFPGEFKSFGLEGLRIMQAHAEEAGCDMIIHAGDFCHGTPDAAELIEAYNNFHIPSYHCLGNHDMDKCSIEEILKAYRMAKDYYHFDKGGYRFIVINTSYYRVGNEYFAYSKASHAQHLDTRETLPPEQLEWIKTTIDESPYPCILISHASLERVINGVQNYKEVLKIIDDANRKKKHSVLMSINGHHHVDYIRLLNNVVYFDMNSTSMDWLGSMNPPNNAYPEEEYKGVRMLHRTIYTNDPLYAIITLDGTTITIEGRESTMYRGVTRESLGIVEYDEARRLIKPSVSSAKITLG